MIMIMTIIIIIVVVHCIMLLNILQMIF